MECQGLSDLEFRWLDQILGIRSVWANGQQPPRGSQIQKKKILQQIILSKHKNNLKIFHSISFPSLYPCSM